MKYEKRTIPGYPDYSVDVRGDVFSSKSGVELKLKPQLNGRANRKYRKVKLSKNGSVDIWKVGRLVLLAFVGPLPDGLLMRHLNDVATDDRLVNLEYGSFSENSIDVVRNGNHKKAKLTERDVLQIKELLSGGHKQSEIADQFGVSRSTIQEIKSGRNWSWVGKPLPKRKTAWQVAIEVLRETGNPAVMWGDEGLLHLIAERLGWPHECTKTSDRVMKALNRNPGSLVKKKTQLGNGRIVSIFRLPE